MTGFPSDVSALTLTAAERCAPGVMPAAGKLALGLSLCHPDSVRSEAAPRVLTGALFCFKGFLKALFYLSEEVARNEVKVVVSNGKVL